MAFHVRKVLTHLCVDSLHAQLQTSSPGIAGHVDWTGTEKEVQGQVEQALLADHAERADLIAALQRVFLMANNTGDRAMIAACGTDIALRQELSAQPNSHERALWLLAHDPARFEWAEEIRYSDYHFDGKSWTGFVGPRGAWPELAGEPLQLFKERVETAFRQFDGSGTNIVVEPFERGPASFGRHGEGRVVQLVAYLEGLPVTATEFGDGVVVRRSVRPAVEVALVYAQDTGVIDVIARAGRQLREAVAKAFVEELFPQSDSIEPVRLRQVNLSGLARPRRFHVDPKDGIDGVRLTALRFGPSGVAGRVTLEVGAKDGPTLHELSHSWFGSNDPLARGPAITRARVAIRFHPTGGKRGRTLQVELTEPHGCNLRDRSDMERLVGEKYLKLWDLVRDI